VQKRLRKALDDLSIMESAWQLALLGEKSVQVDLALEQSARKHIDSMVEKFSAEWQELLRDAPALTPAQRRDRFLESARTNKRDVQSILDKNQIKRLQQIRLQLQGFMAFNEPEIIATLQLTESQRQALRQIEGETFMFMKDRGNIAKEVTRESRKKLLLSAMEKSLAVLTPNQRSQWQSLLGSTFKGQVSDDLPGIPPQL
jgi:hypothetical protein